jgi:ADP-heptose:LPS heptosyltransferase
VRRRLLVLRPGAIGDSLLTTPALAALRRRYPAYELLMAGNAAALPVLAALGLVDAWWPFDGPAVTRLFMPRAPAPDDAFLDLAVGIAWGSDPDGVLADALRGRGAADPLIAPSQPPAGAPVHVARHLVRTLAPLGVPDLSPVLPELRLPAEIERQADAILTQTGLEADAYAVVHPGSGAPGKNWPAERFARVIDALRAQHGLATLLLAGPADDEVVRRVAASLERPVPVVQNGPLLVASGLLRRARLFLGNDSGLGHLAGLLGVPTLTLFGPTDPARWAPLGPSVQVLRHQPLAHLDAETVLAELATVLEA